MMKSIGIALTILGTALFVGAPVGAAESYVLQEPFAVYGNTYYVNPGDPHATVDVEGASAAVASLKCGVLASAQPDLSGLWERKAKPPALGSVAFIDNDACRSYAGRARAWLPQTRADDAAATKTNEVAQ
ncbi:hypothetical protein [Massilia rhizosphaerae]|uniref:hypothetical protein n=1 Tax=Massilia rhizosphaerae TaxID=2784389 RepID=UPI0018DB0A46|nr:hypothetical protein [Massilia rhizosphaerae]